MTKLRPYGFFWVAMLLLTRAAHSQNDSSTTLRNVTLTSLQKKNSFLSITPAQRLDRTTLFKLNAITVGDAARFFSGVQVKDYGGVGGLKTLSVRSLGASHTGILYDGITVADAQTGQTDLNRFSNTFIQSLTVQQAGPDQLLQPARAFASSAVLSINTTSFYPALTQKKELQAGLKPGSFGLWQPSLGLVQPLSKRLSLSANAEGLLSKGNYPFRIENGNRSEDATRENGNTRSLQVESNLTALFKDSSVLQAKVWGLDRLASELQA